MDSDSSLDGEFESKHEVAARRNSAAAQSESDGEENDESDFSSTDSEDEKHEPADPTRRDSSPASQDVDGSGSERGNHSPSPVHFKPRSPSLDRENWPRRLDGGGLPSEAFRNRSPGSNQEKLSPNSLSCRRSSSLENERGFSILEDGKGSPTLGDGKHSSPCSEGRKHSPSLEGGKLYSSLEDGKHSPSSEGGRRSPSTEGGRRSPSSEGGRRSPSSEGGCSPSSEGGRHSPSSEEGRCSHSLEGGRNTPSSEGGRRSPSSLVEQHSPSSEGGRHTPSSVVRQCSTSRHVEKHTSNLKMGKRSQSLNRPRSPSFLKQIVRSPDPGKCTPSSDREDRSPTSNSRVQSPGDRSPSTDYGKQSPVSGHGRWTPSPDHTTRSPKLLRGSELGEESVGSCSGIRSPSLNGDTRSSRAWSPSPERDKHFRVVNQEAQSAIANVSALQSLTPENVAGTEEMVSRSESGILLSSRDSEKQSPQLSCKVLSPKSNFCELLPILDHKQKAVKSPRSHSPDSNDGETSPKISDKASLASPAVPDSNDDGELSDSSRDISVEPKKLSKQAAGEKVKEKSQTTGKAEEAAKKNNITSHGEDLSDVSDLEIIDGAESLGEVLEDHDKKLSKGPPPAEDVEQLDFEAEEREEGECEAREDGKSEDEGELKGDELEEGELTDDDENRPEETEPRPICRFYSRGQCTWGASCRFLHPGVTDKGNYTMFDMVRPLVTINGPPMYPMEYRVPVPVPYEKPPPVIPYQGPRKEEPQVFESAWERGLRQAKEMMRKSTKRKEMDMDFEEKKMNLSLGQEELDKENDYYTRQASPIKEEPERWSSYDRLKGAEPDGKYGREGSVFEEYPSEHPYYHQHGRGEYWRRVQYEPGGGESRSGARIDSSEYRSSSKYRRSPSDHYYEKYDKKKKSSSSHSTREVIMQRVEKPWRDERYAEVTTASSHRGRGDEWADPWMRSKSPTGRKGASSRPTRKSYSSGSSYSSSSSSRSSSRSSYSSYSHDSRSRSHSKSFSRSRSRSRSHSPAARRRKPNRPLVPTARAAMAAGEALSPSFHRVGKLVPELRTLTKAKPTVTTLLTASEKKAVTERAPLMNPPPPTPRKPKDARPPSPGMMRKVAQNPPPPAAHVAKGVGGLKAALERPKLTVAGAASIKAKMRSHSASSRSSSGSDSSGSSSDSSESSYSSSSSSREPSPKVVRPQKRMVIDERDRLALTQSMKIKAMDALKLSGQKQQIKLTLKTPGSVGGSTNIGAMTVKKPGTGLPELPELNLVRRERGLATLAGKKRPAEDTAVAEQAIAAKMAALSKPAAKKATSRREELLKQLKAVEDAIARKRSKIIP